MTFAQPNCPHMCADRTGGCTGQCKRASAVAREPAFPTEPNTKPGVYVHHGLTKREYFAGLAMQGLLAHTGSFGEPGSPGVLSCRSVQLADALIAELAKEPS